MAIKDRRWSVFIVDMVKTLKPRFDDVSIASDKALLMKVKHFKENGYKVLFLVTFKILIVKNIPSRTVIFEAVRQDGEGEDCHIASLYNVAYDITDDDLSRLGKKSFLELKANFEYTATAMFAAAHVRGN